MHTVKSLYLFLSLFLAFISFSQEKWSLQKCFEHAMDSNLTIQSKQVDLLIAEIQQKQNRLNALPNLNAGATHGFNWGQSIDPFTNQFASDRIRTNNLYAGSNWDIFSGLQNHYLKRQGNLNMDLKLYEIELAKRNLKIDITAAFMQIVLNNALKIAAQSQVDYAIKSEQLAKEKLDLGYITTYDYLAISSQLALDSVRLIQAENNEKHSVLLLKQLLNLEEDILVDIPGIDHLENKTYTYNKDNYTQNPEFQLAQIQTDLQAFQLKLAKSRLIPTMAINSSIGSGYSGNNKTLVGSEFLPKPFNVQLQENFYQSSVLTLNVPIFNNGRVRSEIKIAEAELTRTKIDQEIMFQQLRNQLDQLENEINNEKVNLDAQRRAKNTFEKRLQAAEIQYESGNLNVQNYLDTRNNYFEYKAAYVKSLILLRFKEEMMGLIFQ